MPYTLIIIFSYNVHKRFLSLWYALFRYRNIRIVYYVDTNVCVCEINSLSIKKLYNDFANPIVMCYIE